MAKHYDLRNALNYIRNEYPKSKESFRFTAADMAKAIDTSEKNVKGLMKTINTRAQFWRGNFAPKDNSYTVDSQVFERIKDMFK